LESVVGQKNIKQKKRLEMKRVSYKNKYLETKEELEFERERLRNTQKELSLLQKRFKEMKNELALTDKEATEYLDCLKRLKAEFENYKKRSLKEKERIVKFANEDLIKQFFPLLDDLERALESVKGSKNSASFLEGIKIILVQFKHLLKNQGVEEIKAQGEEFNPYFHEAIMQVESNEYPDNLVVEEIRKGYKLKDRILRPAMVKVNKRNNLSSSVAKKKKRKK